MKLILKFIKNAYLKKIIIKKCESNKVYKKK